MKKGDFMLIKIIQTSIFFLYSISFLLVGLSIGLNQLEKSFFKSIENSTVMLKNETYNYSGSGLIIKKNKNKYILTNAHVCQKNNFSENVIWSVINDERQEAIHIGNEEKISNEIMDYCFMKYDGKISGYNLERDELDFKIYDFLYNKINYFKKKNEKYTTLPE